MLSSPYDASTMQNAARSVKSTRMELEKLLVDGDNLYTDVMFPPTTTVLNGLYFLAPPSREKLPINEFHRPIRFGRDNTTAIDLRPYINYVNIDDNNRLVLPNEGPVLLPVIEGALTHIWENDPGRRLSLYTSLPGAAMVYAQWIANAIYRRMSVDVATQAKLKILAGYHYYSCFIDKENIDKNRLILILARASRVDGRIINDVIDNVELDGRIETFCDAVKNSGWSKKLESFNLGVLVALTSRSWWGNADSPEQCVVSLEYPPTFIATVYQAVGEKLARKTEIGEITRFLLKQSGGVDYKRSVNRFIASLGN